ncbi:MAG: ribosome assembly cofactor RimP [Rikenellaceae bacterium]
MIDKSKIVSIAQEYLSQNSELFLVDVKIAPSNEIEVIIDSDTNVGVDTCITLSRSIESEFDRESEDFQLTVTSAGIGQALKLERQMRKVLEKEVEVLLLSGIKLKGILTGVDSDSITIKYEEKVAVEGKKRKQVVETEKNILVSQTKSIKEIISFR